MYQVIWTVDSVGIDFLRKFRRLNLQASNIGDLIFFLEKLKLQYPNNDHSLEQGATVLCVQ
jgi:hypothetical protein